MKSLSDTCRDKAPTVSSSPFFYTFLDQRDELFLSEPLAPAGHRRSIERQTVAEAQFAAEVLSSGPREFHPQPLTEPDVILSHHPALVTQPLRDQGAPNERRMRDCASQCCSAAAGSVPGAF